MTRVAVAGVDIRVSRIPLYTSEFGVSRPGILPRFTLTPGLTSQGEEYESTRIVEMIVSRIEEGVLASLSR